MTKHATPNYPQQAESELKMCPGKMQKKKWNKLKLIYQLSKRAEKVLQSILNALEFSLNCQLYSMHTLYFITLHFNIIYYIPYHLHKNCILINLPFRISV